MSDGDVYSPSASSTKSFDTSYSSSKKEMEVARTLQPYEGRTVQTKISTHTDQDGFLCAVFRSRLEQKSPVTKCLVCFVCDLFPMSKSMLRMGSFLYLFVFVDVIFYSFALSAAKVALGHCSRVSLL